MVEPPPVSQHTTIDIGDESVTNSHDLGFYESPAFAIADEVTGSIGDVHNGKGRKRYRKLSQGGSAASFLESRGFGWLLEVDDDDEEEQKSLLEELDIDLKEIYYKIRCILLPLPYFRLKLSIVRESPDFWGPLLVVMAYALLSLYGQLSVLSWILTMWLSGSFLVFFLARVLGGDVSYSQVLGVVGYCLIPIAVVGIFIPFFAKFRIFKFLLCCFGITWSVYSAGALLCVEELQEKRSLLLYPVFLLYVYFLSLYTGV